MFNSVMINDYTISENSSLSVISKEQALQDPGSCLAMPHMTGVPYRMFQFNGLRF